MRLMPGDQVVADGMLAPSAPVVRDESLLAGEAAAVEKRAGDTVLSGSYCVSGAGYYVATRVSAASSVNMLTAQAKAYKIQLTPTQKSINTLVKTLTAILILFVALLLMAAYIKHVPLKETILSLVTVIKALVPEGLVLVSTLAFAMGALRAARRHVLVQKLGAVESLGHLTVLCLDKTGTLGTNRLQFEVLVPFALSHDELARYLGLLLGAVSAQNQTTEAIASAFPTLTNPGLASAVIDGLPFSTEHKTSAVRVGFNGEEVSLWLGAPEAMAEDRLAPVQAVLTDFRQRGLRVMLFARSAQVLTLLAPAVGKQSTENFLRGPLKFALLAGLCTAFFSLLVYANFFLFQDRAEQYGSSAGVSVIVLMDLYVLFRLTGDERGPTASAAQRLAVWGLLIGAPLLHGAAVYWPPLRDVLGMVSLDTDSWITILAASGLGMVTMYYLMQDAIRKRFFGM